MRVALRSSTPEVCERIALARSRLTTSRLDSSDGALRLYGWSALDAGRTDPLENHYHHGKGGVQKPACWKDIVDSVALKRDVL